MWPNISSKQSDAGHGPYRLLLSVGLPFLLLLAFLSQQVFNFDNIGWSHGFSHPLTGWDHLVTMLAVGIWAAQLRGQAVWMLPLAFVGVMSLGGLAGAAGISIPSVEGIILLSCAVFSVLITRKIRFSAKINVMIVAFFAFFHGFAHGQEISTSASLISYTLGFMLATLLLHGAGILVAKLVVLAVTCLLAAMFSSSALAKYAATQEQNSPVSSTKILSDGRGSFDYSDLNQSAQRVFQSDSVIGINCLEYFRSNFSEMGKSASINASNQASTAKLKLVTDFSGLRFKTKSVNALNGWQMFSLRADYYCAPGDLSFKKHYPAINHTPGTHLLSNGVGLTSPPVANDSAYAKSAVPNFRKNIQFVIEDQQLQLTFASFDIGTTPHLHSSNDGLLLIRPHEVLISVRLELVERLLVLRQAQHERLKHLRAGSIDSFHALIVVSDFQKDAALRQISFVGYLALTYPVLSTGSIGLAATNKPNLVTIPDKFDAASQVFASELDEMQIEITPPYCLNAEIGIAPVYASDT